MERNDNKPVIDLTRQELVTLLRNVNTPMFISFVSNTPVVMNQYDNYWTFINGEKKKNPDAIKNPYYEMGIMNLCRKYKIVTGFDYQNSVNGRREKEDKEPDFIQQDNWFEVISKGLVTDKKTQSKFYIRYQYLNDSITEQEYSFEGNQIERTLFESYMRERSTYSNQGLDNPLQFQVCNIDNLLEIAINGNVYKLV